MCRFVYSNSNSNEERENIALLFIDKTYIIVIIIVHHYIDVRVWRPQRYASLLSLRLIGAAQYSDE